MTDKYAARTAGRKAARYMAQHPSGASIPASGGGNQSIGYTPISISASQTTDGGLGEPTGTIFGTYTPDVTGYFDANPFGGGGVMPTGNSPVTSNQSIPYSASFFGANPNANPAFSGSSTGPDNSSSTDSAADQQIKLNAEEIVKYAVIGGLILAGMYLYFKG